MTFLVPLKLNFCFIILFLAFVRLVDSGCFALPYCFLFLVTLVKCQSIFPLKEFVWYAIGNSIVLLHLSNSGVPQQCVQNYGCGICLRFEFFWSFVSRNVVICSLLLYIIEGSIGSKKLCICNYSLQTIILMVFRDIAAFHVSYNSLIIPALVGFGTD